MLITIHLLAQNKQRHIFNFQRKFQSFLSSITGIHGNNTPYHYNGKSIIPWTFSLPFFKHNLIEIKIGTPITDIGMKVLEHLAIKNIVQLGQEQYKVAQMVVDKNNYDGTSKNILVKTLSPIVVQHQVPSEDTYFLFPNNKLWKKIINNNIKSKLLGLNIIGENEFVPIDVKIKISKPYQIFYKKEEIVSYYYGIAGQLYITGEPHVLKHLEEIGIGYGNSKGLGMVQIIKNIREGDINAV